MQMELSLRFMQQKAITTPNNLSPKILPITDKNGTAISDDAADYLPCFSTIYCFLCSLYKFNI